jgi:hypothetical protein
MIVTGLDSNREDIIEWWLDNALNHHKTEKIGVWDLGMSSACRNKLERKYKQVWFSEVIDGHIPLHEKKIGWYYKIHCVKESPEQSVVWVDSDCQILTDISDIFHLVPSGQIGLTKDWGRSNWWATGVIVVNDRPSLLDTWHERLWTPDEYGELIRGDQEALNDLIGTGEHEQIVELPQEYQWLRASLNRGIKSDNVKVIHWTGPAGKRFITDVLMKGGQYTGQQVE